MKEVTAMTTPIALRNGFPSVAPGTRLLGEVISWTCPGAAVRHADLVAALADPGLDTSVARELLPRHAFARACKKLAKDRIIRPVAEDEATITFQFTQESRAGDEYEYTLETMLALEKATGKVKCELAGLATLTQEQVDAAIDARTGTDITRCVKRLFDRHADLFPVREKGSVYFVPQAHADFVASVQQFLGRVNGRLARFPVPEGTPQGDRSVKDAVASGIAAMIADHRSAVESFGSDTRKDTLERAAERVKRARHKLSVYAEYLADERTKLERELAESSPRLWPGPSSRSSAGPAEARSAAS
jgi:hypothetical protein